MQNYNFQSIKNCNMCGENISETKTLGIRINRSQGKSPKKIKHGIGLIILRCKNCGLIFSNPRPLPKSINDHYNIPGILHPLLRWWMKRTSTGLQLILFLRRL